MNVRRNQHGAINILLIPLILVSLLFFVTLGFGIWAYTSRQDYKENADEKIATAVEVAKKETATQKDNEFIEREKQPLQEYKGPSSFGTVTIKYPKTWSAYVDDTGGGSAPVDGYFHPSTVPGIASDATFALRVQVTEKTFADELRTYDSDVKQGKTKARPYKPENVENIVGSRLEGEIGNQTQGILILLPLRDKTIKIWTESDQFVKDFNENILKNLEFSP